MLNEYWKRSHNGLLDASVIAIAIVSGWFLTTIGATRWADFDVPAILGGEFWRIATAQWIVPNNVSALFSLAVTVTSIPRLVRVCGRGLFWFLLVLLTLASAVAVLMALVAAGYSRFQFPLPPLVLMVGFANLFLPSNVLRIGGLRIRSQLFGAATIVCAVLVGWIGSFSFRPFDAFILVSLLCLAAAVALVAAGVLHHRALLRQFAAFQQSQMRHPILHTANVYQPAHRVEEQRIPLSFSTEEEYADALLEKIHQHGVASLTEQERQFLQDYAQRL